MYNTTHVTLHVAKDLAIAYMRAGIIPLLVSPPGTGKTTTVQDIAREMNAELRCIRLNSIPPEEALGLQYLDHDTRRTIRYAPSWVPAQDGSDGDVVVFCDELMQAPDEYRKGIMSALLERHLGDHQIPDNCMFIAAGNSVEDGSNVYELDRATADRFGVIVIRPDFETWANSYAEAKKVDPAIMGYLRMRPEHFDLTEEENAQDKVIKPSPRSWIAASAFLDQCRKDGVPAEVIKAGLKGKLGEEIGGTLWTLIGSLEKLPSLEALLEMSPTQQAKNTPATMDVMWAYGQSMIWHAKSNERIVKIISLFDAFETKVEIPLVECRSYVMENILQRARHVHDFSVHDDERIKDALKRWRIEVKEEIDGNNDNVQSLRAA